MAVSTGILEQLAHECTQLAAPEQALRALGALRDELDELERELVVRALRAGASWSHIARSLGVSKQAAHRKHRHLILAEDESAPRPTATAEARETITRAKEEAQNLRQPTLASEHLLLGILRCQHSLAARCLAGLGVTYEAAFSHLQTTMPGASAQAAAIGSGPNVSAQARRIIEGARREAQRRGEHHVGVEHLLLAILADSRNGAVQTLEQLRLTPRMVRAELARTLESGGPAEAGGAESALR